jgi:hypothetical protein
MSETGKGQIWIEVLTSKRSYCVRGGARVVWTSGEKVISMEVIRDGS